MTYGYNSESGKYEGEHLGVKYVLKQDSDAIDPRKDCDWLGTMACEHHRYSLGDKDATSALTDAIRSSAYYRDGWEQTDGRYARHYKGDASEPDGISKMIGRCRDIISLPLYLYDHSGITMNTGGFSCQWDSGQVGFIFVTLEKLVKEYPDRFAKFKRPMISSSLRAMVVKQLEAEVEVYDKYLTGDVYGYSILNDEEMGSEVWGYYGDQSAAEAAEEYIDGLTDEERTALIAVQVAAADEELECEG